MGRRRCQVIKINYINSDESTSSANNITPQCTVSLQRGGYMPNTSKSSNTNLLPLVDFDLLSCQWVMTTARTTKGNTNQVVER